MKSSVGKWLAGIAASIITTLVIWYLTHSGGPLNPSPSDDEPILRIVDFQITDAPLGGRAHATVSVFNEGSVTGEACTVWWYSGTNVARELDEGRGASEAASSYEFGLPPGKTKVVEMDSLPYTEIGEFRSYIQASCSGVDIISIEYYQFVKVRP